MTESLYGYRLRPHQQAILDYRGGLMGVAAVPGAGKTLTLALLAARLIAEGHVPSRGQVLVVTVLNSAVDNISRRIKAILQSQGLPAVGYRVCTLHRLGADILRYRNDVAGVEDTFAIVDGADSERLMGHAVNTWISSHQALWESYLAPEQLGSQSVRENWRRVTIRIGTNAVKACKHLRLTPEQAALTAKRRGIDNSFALMGIQLYALYQSYLGTQNALDFDDLIWRAIDSLDQDASLLAGLRERWPFILEDEAQDSSPLQEDILRRLSWPGGNWVRMGDPNQSINSTFTSADPRYFRRFLADPEVSVRTMPTSGRSAQPVIDLANRLVAWVSTSYPLEDIRQMAFEPQMIQPTAEGDPQPNPPAVGGVVRLAEPLNNQEDEVAQTVELAARFVRYNQLYSQAILCPTNKLGEMVMRKFEKNPKLNVDDLLKSTPQTRQVARVLHTVFHFISSPNRSGQTRLFKCLLNSGVLGAELATVRERTITTLLNSGDPEEVFFAAQIEAWYTRLPADTQPTEEEQALLARYIELGSRWLRASILPPDQLLLTIAQDLFSAENELAIAQLLANRLRSLWQANPAWRIAEFSSELSGIANNKSGLGEVGYSDIGYEPQPGRIAVTTMHKAKGLEWDVVYLLSIDDLEFPDRYESRFRSEPYFMPGRMPDQEAGDILAQLTGSDPLVQDPAAIIRESQSANIAERLRLLYVAITRAQRHLWLSYTHNNQRTPVGAPAALLALFNKDTP
ncbi:MAG: ATP-dependent helicase [Chloroflexi bacterium]|mgnify:CR=1 FL=1|nr:ATP-dependent helicase [Chloroflexota bacterium]